MRLKGGDVHVFARGIEEVAACVAAGVPVEVVPGVSSALAGPAYAGIPVTARGVTQSFAVVSAHLPPGDPGSTVDWDALARLGGTLVLLMAVGRLPAVCAALVAGGRSRSTPVAVVQDASLPTQRDRRHDPRRRGDRRCGGARAGRRRRRRGRRAEVRRVTVLLGVAHGSKDPGSQDVVEDLLRRTALLRPGLDARAAYVDNASPSIRRALAELAGEGADDVVVLPLLLTPASHSKTDVAASVQAARRAHPGVRLRYGRPLGPHPVLVDVLARRLAEAGADPAAPVVLVAGGALDPAANADVAHTARLLFEGRTWPSVDVAFASTARPSVPEALERLRRQGESRVSVARYFLGPGHLPRLVERQAREAGLDVVVSAPLGSSDELAGLLAGRFDEALVGDLRMNCDVCLYRTPLPQREHLVGALQEPHAHPDDQA